MRAARPAAGLLAAALFAAPLGAREAEAPLQSASLEEHLGAQLPLDTPLLDASGQRAPLREFLGGDPALLVLGYYRCEMLCTLVLDAAARAVADLERAQPGGAGTFRALSLSIDPRDDASSASARQRRVLAALGWPPQRWPFLLGAEADVRAIAERVGFGYRYDAASGQYAHPAALIVLGADGRVSSYLYGIDFDSRELADALRAARAGRLRSPLQRALLRCFQYAPALRRYGAQIAWFLRLGALATLTALGLWLVRLCRAIPARGDR